MRRGLLVSDPPRYDLVVAVGLRGVAFFVPAPRSLFGTRGFIFLIWDTADDFFMRRLGIVAARVFSGFAIVLRGLLASDSPLYGIVVAVESRGANVFSPAPCSHL